MEAAVGRPSHVPKLEEDDRALFMDGVGGVLPPFGHLLGVDARRLVPAVGLLGDRGRLGDEQARRTALGVVFGHQAVRQASGPGRPGAEFDEIQQQLERQRARPARIRIPAWEEVRPKLATDSWGRRWPRVVWNRVCYGHQPEL